ncbi:carbohydrate ABC transporter permease [Alicyclobacillus tolerans]|uniref:Carbohydrate ABC transporter membrane protein 1, CUT1 family n=2 Tax=Alicyclobacillus tolerans TaxID=90970 RepID=A0A1M6P195_9BACL|nr:MULTISPECIES: sugar ABC transporter permease [Alicyclobacillus]MDP9729148.1 multiple sugar transport system permease protein [Alicyclobacillus tengchongensis]QRF22695.1 sugar ABC transporter permease [Alicyclobacillus sp. TC]SHK01735.1 carbohydrate ABC transporter membrane protein 1, CUT1 family [Alicyclobacillus montanus]
MAAVQADSQSRSGGRFLREKGMQKWRRQETVTAYLFSLPTIILLLMFSLGPAVYAFFLSGVSWNLLDQMHWIGLHNYAAIFRMPLFWTAVKNSFIFAAVVMPVQTIIAMIFAVIMNQHLPARPLFRLAFFFPSISSSAVTSLMFMWIFNKLGLLNGFLNWFGISGPDWIGDPRFALSAIMILNIWSTSGYFMVVFLAGLQSIPQNFYEAAAIDGASAFQRFLRITVPLLRPSTFFIVVMGMIGTLQMFDQSFIISGGTGGPLNSTMTMALLIYEEIFSYGNVGYGAAITVFLFVVVLLLTLLTNRWLGKPIEY